MSELNRIKAYLKKVKDEKVEENSSEDILSDAIIRFVGPLIEPEAALHVIKTRLARFEQHKACLQLFIEMTKNSQESVLAPEIISSFENLFRNTPNHLV